MNMTWTLETILLWSNFLCIQSHINSILLNSIRKHFVELLYLIETELPVTAIRRIQVFLIVIDY